MLMPFVNVELFNADGLDAADTGTFGFSLTTGAGADTGLEEAEAENGLQVFEGELDFSVNHVGPSLDGVLAGVTVVDLRGSGWGLILETWVFVGRSRNGELVFVERDFAQFL